MIRLVSAYLTPKEFIFNSNNEVNDDVVFNIRNILYEKVNNCIYEFGNNVEIVKAEQEEFLAELYYLIAHNRFNYNIEMLNNLDLDFYTPVIKLTLGGIRSLYELLTNDNLVKNNWYFNINTIGGSEIVDAEQLAKFIKNEKGKVNIKSLFILEIDYVENIEINK